MDCIYLNCVKAGDCYCHAQPAGPREALVYYKPTEDELKKFCRNAEKFGECRRLYWFESYLKACKT